MLTDCTECGARLLWLYDLSRRPLEAHPLPPRPGEEGYTIVRTGAGHRVWRDTWDCVEPPPLHYRVHRCPGSYAVAISLGHSLRKHGLLR